ncbi:MAG: response regulator [Deltaproteobacteria bacterium]|nr:response regulator [Deltaproteobacteria bacterium]
MPKRPPIQHESVPAELDALRREVARLEAQAVTSEEVRLQLEATQRRYTRVFEEMLDGFALHEILCDLEGHPVDYRFLDVNPAFERQTGLKASEVVGRRVREVLPDLEPQWIETYGRVALTGEAEHFSEYSQELDQYFEVTAYQPEAHQFACIFHDVTARVKAEEERRALELRFLQTQKLESLGVLAGGIAHDFNNLLMGVLGNASLALKDMPVDAPARETVQSIEIAARHAAKLVQQLLAYSGQGQTLVERIDLNALVEEMAHLLGISTSKRAAIHFDCPPNLPAIEVDATQVRQVVMNLITNASEAIGDDSGTITVRTGAKECDREYLERTAISRDLPEGVYVFLEVSDDGVGMDEETQARIFDPFFTTKFTGRGLGLAAVQGIIRAHRGVVLVYSEPGRGTTFKILLPAAEGLRRTPRPEETTLPAARGWVLLVDDEESVRQVATTMLEVMGLNVVPARDGREALDLFRASPDQFSLVLLDLTMPHMHGDEVYQQMRQLRPKVPVLMCSGYNAQEIRDRFAEKGVDGFVQKPYTFAELATQVEALLDRD